MGKSTINGHFQTSIIICYWWWQSLGDNFFGFPRSKSDPQLSPSVIHSLPTFARWRVGLLFCRGIMMVKFHCSTSLELNEMELVMRWSPLNIWKNGGFAIVMFDYRTVKWLKLCKSLLRFARPAFISADCAVCPLFSWYKDSQQLGTGMCLNMWWFHPLVYHHFP